MPMTSLACIGEEMIQRNQLLSPVVRHAPVVLLLSGALVVLRDDSNRSQTQHNRKPIITDDYTHAE